MDDTPPGDARAGSQLPNSDVRTHAAPPRLRFRVPPEPSHLRRARERIRDYLRQYSAERDLIDDLVLCVEEAATNAIRHSGVDADIEIALEFDDGCLVALVKDRGVGFDVTSFRPERVPDPGKDHGRGLFIIAALMDSLDLSVDGGLEVRMKRKTAARPVAAALDSGLGELSVWGDPATTSSALEQREARTRALLDEVDEAFVALDWEYRYVHANRMAVRMLERSLPELLGRTLWELFPHLADDPLGERFRDAMELGKPSVSDHRSQVSGDWIEVRIYPTSVGVSVYYREIAERKRAELERETTIAFLHLVNESETLGALADATIAFFERHSGCEAVGLRLRDGDDNPYVITRGLSPEFVALERSLAGLDDESRVCRDAAGHATLECLCGDVVGGRLDPAAPYTTARGSFWCNDTAALLATIDQNARQAPLRGRCMSEGYQSVALVGLRVGDERLGLLQLNDRRTDRFAAADIELWERLADQLAVAISKLRLEEELHDSRSRERFLAEVVEDAAAPFGVGAPDGRLLFFNQAFADLTGYSRQELESRAITWAIDLTPKRWRKPEAALLAKAVRDRRPVRYEKEYVRKDGAVLPVEAFVQPIFDAAGELVHYRSFMTDISQRKRAQQERRSAELERERLLEDSQTQAEELQNQGEELRLQNEELRAQRDAIVRESEPARRPERHLRPPALDARDRRTAQADAARGHARARRRRRRDRAPRGRRLAGAPRPRPVRRRLRPAAHRPAADRPAGGGYRRGAGERRRRPPSRHRARGQAPRHALARSRAAARARARRRRAHPVSATQRAPVRGGRGRLCQAPGHHGRACDRECAPVHGGARRAARGRS